MCPSTSFNSPDKQSEELFRVGLMLRPHGVRGELLVLPLTDDAQRFLKLKSAFAEARDANAGASTVMISGVRFLRGKPIIKLKDCDDIDKALQYKGRYLSVTRDQLAPLGENTWYVFDLIGCEARDPLGNALGVLQEVIETGSADAYVIRDGIGDELLVPAIKQVVKNVDIKNKVIVIDVSAIDTLEPETEPDVGKV